MAPVDTAALPKRPARKRKATPASNSIPEAVLKNARLDSPELYLNPHLSLLAFQRRVLEEAQDAATPLLERIKFLTILSSNIDEFFMVRVAGLWQQIDTRSNEISLDGRSPVKQLELIRQDVTTLVGDAYRCWREDLVPARGRQYSDPEPGSIERSAADGGGRSLSPHRVSHPDTAGGGPGTAVSAHLESQPEHRRHGKPRRAATFCAHQGARHAAATGAVAFARRGAGVHLAGTGDHRQPTHAVSGDGDSGSRSLSPDARRRTRHSGTRGYLLDTNVPSELTRPRPDARVAQWLENTDDDLMHISVITVAEVFKDITIHPQAGRREWLQRWFEKELRPWFVSRILPVTEPIAERCGVLEGQCHLNGIRFNVPDGLIAATAIENSLTIVTRNVRDFAALGGAILDPWER